MIIISQFYKNFNENFRKKNPQIVLAYGLQRKVNNIENVNLNEKIEKNYELIKNHPIKLAMRNSMFNPSQFLVKTDICKSS